MKFEIEESKVMKHTVYLSLRMASDGTSCTSMAVLTMDEIESLEHDLVNVTKELYKIRHKLEGSFSND